MAKNKLTKGTLSLGQIEKDAMPEIFTVRLNAKQ